MDGSQRTDGSEAMIPVFSGIEAVLTGPVDKPDTFRSDIIAASPATAVTEPEITGHDPQ